MTKIVNLRKENYDIYIGRGSIFGNPFVIGRDGTREDVINKYREYAMKDPIILANLFQLQGKKLGCFCKPKACHGDVLVDMLNNLIRTNL